ncbi:DNA polymerase I [Neisseriaceae bacterium CLB008]
MTKLMKTLLLVDGSSYLYRAFHAMPDLRSPDGLPTGALYGVLNMLRRLQQDVPHDYAACIFDAKGKTFRNDMYPEYKANRPPMPDDLRLQVDKVHDLVARAGWPIIVLPGVEADDVIGTLARQADEAGFKVVISTGDKDMAQLVSDNVTIVNTMTNETFDEAGVVAKFGVKPNRIIDYLTLIGDKVDNVPGVDKCGPKTALKWLEAYDSLEGVIEHAAEIKGKVGEHLQAAIPHLPLSYELITIKCDVPLDETLPKGWDDLSPTEPQWSQLVEDYKAFGFRTWLKEAEKKVATPATQANQTADLFASDAAEPATADLTANVDTQPAAYTPPAPVALHYAAITTDAQLDALCRQLDDVIEIGFDTETTSLNTQEAQLIGMSIATAPGVSVYIPLGHSMTAVPDQLPLASTLAKLKPYLENPKLGKIGQNLKYDQHVLANYDLKLNGIVGDAMLASYLVESHLTHNLDDLAIRHLGLTTITYESLCGKGVKQLSFADVALDDAMDYACQDADFALRLHHALVAQMNDVQKSLYHDMELPLAQVLLTMEQNGVYIDKDVLMRQSHELGQKLLQLEQQAYEIAGQPFNLNSPKQLQEILFDKLEIPTKGLKKTASGGISTNESVLEKLALDYPLPKLILEYRGLAKLKSTYTDKLPTLINPKTGRVHTTYSQAVAITGRLASRDPNLQNIPVRTEEGRRVRQAFRALPGHQIISADYSQIELRIMAELSQDATLIDAFKQGQDIHRRTAAEIFNVAQDQVTSEQRRYAKTINFGLIYGMGQYGLAQSLEISPMEAKDFIDRYFARYPGVAAYMSDTKASAMDKGYVETRFGRRLYLPDIHSSKAMMRAGAERAAINAPMQGTASDLIKKAMIAVQGWLETEQLDSLLIMQVHDELVLQVPEHEVALVKVELPKLMAAVDTLSIPLVADVGIGHNWDEAH